MSLKVNQLLKDAVSILKTSNVDSPLLDAQLLLAKSMGLNKLDIIIHPELIPTQSQTNFFLDLVKKRADRIPLAYLLGKWEFYGIEFDIDPVVLVPRPETEILVEECIKRLENKDVKIADIGTGSGAIAVALGLYLPQTVVYAVDISQDALSNAKNNAVKYNLTDRLSFYIGDLIEPIKYFAPFDAIVSNPPYIKSEDIPTLQPEVSIHEPNIALDGGHDGLNIYRRIFLESHSLLVANGFIAVEIGIGQQKEIVAIAEDNGFGDIIVVKDLSDVERVVIAYK